MASCERTPKKSQYSYSLSPFPNSPIPKKCLGVLHLHCAKNLIIVLVFWYHRLITTIQCGYCFWNCMDDVLCDQCVKAVESQHRVQPEVSYGS